jgi:hypothetical protein
MKRVTMEDAIVVVISLGMLFFVCAGVWGICCVTHYGY